MLELTYDFLLSKVQEYHFTSRFDVVSFCIGFCGMLDKQHYDMINKLYKNGIISD